MQCTPKASRAAAGDPARRLPANRLSTFYPGQLSPTGALPVRTRGTRSGLAQQDPAHAVLGVLGQDQGGPPSGGGDVLAQVDQVDALPDLVRSGQGHVVGDLGERRK